jgi:hypothetical protein
MTYLLLAAAAVTAIDAEDPAATKLLAEARAARATWADFPGFTADCAVNLDGKVTKGKVTVSATGQVKLDGFGDAPARWAQRTLGSIVGHRMPGADPGTPCRFAGDDADHPFGRTVKVLNDEFHSSYRIKDRQILVVNRTQGEQRFTITVLESRTNAEGKYLSTNFAVNYWDGATGELIRSEANYQSWTRLDQFDLPVTALVQTATRASDGGLTARSVTLSNHQLTKKTAAK